MSQPRPSVRTSCAERAARVRYRRAFSLLVMTLVVPGSAQVVAGNARVGRIAMRVWAGLLLLGLGTLVLAVLDRGRALTLFTNPSVLQLLRLGLMAIAVAWAALLVDAWRISQPLSLMLTHRRVLLGVNGVMCLVVGGVLLFGSHTVGVMRSTVMATFAGNEVVGAHDGRFNVLLIGGDSDGGKTRWGLRTDSMTVASIDASTGKTVLIGLPRNMSDFPFKKGSVLAKRFPHGYDCDECYLNSLSTWAADHRDVFAGEDNPGIAATIEGIEGITGLDINYWALVNLSGFQGLVDAVGGVTLNVRTPIPVGIPGDKFYTHLKTGTRKLNGWETLWYARARHDSDDYSRMARQKCVMAAMLQQVSPQKVLTNFDEIAKAGSNMVSTSIPASQVGRFVSLALKAKSQKVATVSLVPPAIVTAHPDIAKVRSMITTAIDRAEGKKVPKKTRTPTSGAPSGGSTAPAEQPEGNAVVTGGSIGSLQTGYAANQSDDLASAC
ncbi:transcriptional attenuator, LytR family [Nocardioides terrae]|uniref:Transcriptional attenuator, LytR family n=1 Tax=Nocardioides terrae TaxID=574651 RepID=A0A1I1DL45_9ACTN|nr:LCP family protein [Nocardioides terrae]SFB75709.1 transcriptional attenuator, LytR family [Nocardioides terrae]